MSNKRLEEWRVVEWGGVGRGERSESESESARQEVLSSVGAPPPRRPGRESFTRGPGLDVASASSGQSHVPAFPCPTRPTSQPSQSGVMSGQENVLQTTYHHARFNANFPNESLEIRLN